MKVKDLIDVCEEFEYMAKYGKELAAGTYQESEVMVRNDHDRKFLHLAEFFWACRPEAKQT